MFRQEIKQFSPPPDDEYCEEDAGEKDEDEEEEEGGQEGGALGQSHREDSLLQKYHAQYALHNDMQCAGGKAEELKPIGSLLLKYCGLHHHHLQ